MDRVADRTDMTKEKNQTNEPRCEKTGLRGFRPGLTQTGLYSYRRWLKRLEISDLESRGIVLYTLGKQRR